MTIDRGALEKQISTLVASLTAEHEKRVLIDILEALIESQKVDNLTEQADQLEHALSVMENLFQALQPSYLMWHRHGVILFRLGQFEAAIESYRKSIEAHDEGGLWYCWADLGDCHRIAAPPVQDHAKAIEFYQKSIDLHGHGGAFYVWYGLGEVYLREGTPVHDAAKAVQAYEKAIERAKAEEMGDRKRLRDTWSALGRACQQIGQYDDAIKAYKESIRLGPGEGDVVLHRDISRCYELKRSPSKMLAFAHHREAVSQAREYPNSVAIEDREPVPGTRRELLEVLSKRFDLDEFKTLCFCLDIDYDSLAGGNLPGKARELLLYLERTDLTGLGWLGLIEAMIQLRPDLESLLT
jgi:tetratricopeptide (TPR) repeat protein